MKRAGYIYYVWHALWKSILNGLIGAAAVVVALLLLQWNSSGSMQQAANAVSNASAGYLEQMIKLCIGTMPFIGDILDWIESGRLILNPSGFSLFKDFGKAAFLLLATHLMSHLLQMALFKVKNATLLDRLFCALSDLVRVGGLCLLTAAVASVAYDRFTGLVYRLLGDQLATNAGIFALVIILYIIFTFIIGGQKHSFLSRVFSFLVDTALMVCILLYLAIILLTLRTSGFTVSDAIQLIVIVGGLTFAIPFLLRLKLR